MMIGGDLRDKSAPMKLTGKCITMRCPSCHAPAEIAIEELVPAARRHSSIQVPSAQRVGPTVPPPLSRLWVPISFAVPHPTINHKRSPLPPPPPPQHPFDVRA